MVYAKTNKVANIIDESTKLITNHAQSNTLKTTLWHWITTPLLTRHSQNHRNLQIIQSTEPNPYLSDNPLQPLFHTPTIYQP